MAQHRLRARPVNPRWPRPSTRPPGARPDYRQSPVIANGVLFLLRRQVVGGVGHVVLLALDEDNGNPLASFDLGAGGFGAGLANASVATGVVYAPIAGVARGRARETRAAAGIAEHVAPDPQPGLLALDLRLRRALRGRARTRSRSR